MKLLVSSRNIAIPEGVDVEVKARKVRVKGPRGKSTYVHGIKRSGTARSYSNKVGKVICGRMIAKSPGKISAAYSLD